MRNPDKREINVSFSFIKETHAGVEARRRGEIMVEARRRGEISCFLFLKSVVPMKIENHAGVEILRSFFWRKNLSMIHASFWRGGSEIQVMKLKFVPAIQFWRGPVSTLARNLL